MFNFKFDWLEKIPGLEDISSVFSICGVVFLISAIFASVIGIVLYILKAIGVYKMSIKEEITNPWISFIPFINSFALGRLAEKYKKRDGTKSGKFSIALIILQVLSWIFLILFIIFLIVAFFDIINNVKEVNYNESQITLDMFTSLIPVIVFYMLLIGVALAYSVVNFVALWRVYSSFDYSNATLFLVLSIFFSFLSPIFLFVLRNNTPTLDYSERLGKYTYNY